ncbi:elongation factor EF-Tu-like protein [Haematococcus lacustris]
MDESLYDEFGNYIGPELASDQEEDVAIDDYDMDEAERRANERMQAGDVSMGVAAEAGDEEEGDEQGPSASAVVLHEDKKYYPSADEVFGPGVEALVMEEDAQPLEVPIIAPIRQKKLETLEKEPLKTRFTNEFLATLMANPELVRNVALVGHLHHGKTTVMDMLVEQTHEVQREYRLHQKALRFTDTRVDEQSRGMSIKAMPMSLVLEGSSGKSFLLNLVDCPGHVNFNDEVTAALRLCDGMLLCVDAAEGLMVVGERAIKQAVQEGLPICLLITKVDRLITELKLPPADAYYKLKHTIEEVNAAIAAVAGAANAEGQLEVDPIKGNVAFSAAVSGWSFTLNSFARLYADIFGAAFDPREFARRLWGRPLVPPETRLFRRKAPAGRAGCERSFVHFVLEPLYKVYSQVVGEHPKTIERVLSELGVYLRQSAYSQDTKPLLKEACSAVFGTASGLVDMLVQGVPSSKKATAKKVAQDFTGPLDSEVAEFMTACNARGPLVMHVAKLFPKADCSRFDAFGRIVSGTLRPGDKVRVLGESYTPEDEEDSAVATVSAVYVYQARYRIPVARATAGNLVLVEGIDATINKTATVVAEALDQEMHIFRPLRFQTISVVKIATEPLHPSELPKMVDGLRKINKSYPLAVTKVEESGEHTILGTGEMYLDCLMKDLRELYAEVEVKVADPVVSFCETVVETSSLKCFAETPNKRNKLTVVAEPLEKGLAEDIETGAVRIDWPRKKLQDFFTTKYEWDLLAVRGLWAFGPDRQGPNVLLDDTLAGETDKQLLAAIRDSVVQGFQWGAREGPLCDEPLRNVKFKVLDASIAAEPIFRGGGQLIPTARRVCYSAFLMATPRLMEPVYFVEIETPADCIAAIYNVLARRRGHVTADVPKPGTPIFIVKAFIPVVESFGFETDLRYTTQGQAFCMSVFDHWQIVPGDPLDKSVVLRPLEPAPVGALAREFMVKTRRRKGMSDDVSINRFFDDPMLLMLAKQDAELGAIL